ncbi:MAG: hypothetical protein LBD99_04130 [Candidatus Margulisbacteria bacterium]|nr:hypothetical protein [Candidatus Margulisiibacteriota bacterium]
MGTKVCDFEGSNFNGGSTPATNASISYDNNPYATGDPISGTMTFGAAGSGTAGIDYDKIIPPNTVLNIGASITIPSGKYMRLGYDSLATTYPGNSELRVADNQNITIASGASFHSEGNLIAPSGTRWGSLIFEASANSPTVKNTTIRNATIGIADRSDTSYIENSEFTLFAAGSTANYINGSGTYINNRYYSAFQGTPIEIAGGSPKINSNNFTLESGAPFALNIRGGAPYIADNTVNGGGYALDISGGAIGAGQVSRNIFNNPRVKVDNITANLENNYWGAAVPATANFSGSGEIDYEPWWSTSTGAGSTPRQVPVPTYIAPANGAILTSAVDRVTFSIDDIGYHGDAPLEYRLEISQAGDSTFSFPKYSDSASGYARGSTVVHTFPAIGANEYGTYYWRVSVNNTKSDNGNWGTQTAPYSFTIRQPMLNLQLTADKAQASAGEKVTYTLNFSNTETPPTDKLSVVLTAVLPDDVFWNGTLRLITQPDMGTITVKAYSDNGATAQKGATYSSTSAAGTITIPTNSSPGLNIPASEHHTVRRFDVTITKLGSGKAGSLVYETIVK